MKYFLTICTLVIKVAMMFGQAKPTNAYTINGRMNDWNGKYIFFSYKGAGASRVWDSAMVTNNSFQFKGNMSEPSNGFITILKTNRVNNLEDPNITKRLFVGPFNMHIVLKLDHFQEARLKGSTYQDEIDALEHSKLKWSDAMGQLNSLKDSIERAYNGLANKEHSTAELASLQTAIDSTNRLYNAYMDKCLKIDKSFFTNHPGSYITVYLLNRYSSRYTLKELEYFYHRMLPATKNWALTQSIKDAIALLKKATPGSKAPGFVTQDINGEPLSLTQFRGKYVLLDFWASWCKPCREGNPELIRLYKKYNQQGIEFIGIADDLESEDKWRQAVKADHVDIWRQVLDTRIGDSYAVHFIPVQVLIDRDGNIIARFANNAEPHEHIAAWLERVFGN